MTERAARNDNYHLDPAVLGRIATHLAPGQMSIPIGDIRKGYASMFTSVAAEIWLRGREQSLDECLKSLATHMTIRLAEVLSARLARLMSFAV